MLGGDLVVVSSLEIAHTLRDLADYRYDNGFGHSRSVFIGLTDESDEGNFTWVDGSSFEL